MKTLTTKQAGKKIGQNLFHGFTELLPNLTPATTHLTLLLYRGLATGGPLSVDALAERMQISLIRVRTLLNALDYVEHDIHGAVIAYRGLTLKPGRHRIRIAGATLYTWCAFDALFLSAIVRQPVEIESSCPVGKHRLALTIDRYRIVQAQPDGIALSLKIPSAACYASGLRGAFCSFSHFFASRDMATAWQQGHADVMVLSLQAGLQLAQARNIRFFASLDSSVEDPVHQG